MPQPGYNAAGQPTGRLDRSGNYIPNRSLSSRFGGLFNRGNFESIAGISRGTPVAPAAAIPRNPADIAPPGYTQAQWDAMGQTPRITVEGRPVGTRTGAQGNFTPYGGPGYDHTAVQNAASRLAQSQWGSDFASQGGMTGPSQGDMPAHIMQTDEGAPIFAQAATPRLLIEGAARRRAGRAGVRRQIAQLRSPEAVRAYRNRAPRALMRGGGG